MWEWEPCLSHTALFRAALSMISSKWLTLSRFSGALVGDMLCLPVALTVISILEPDDCFAAVSSGVTLRKSASRSKPALLQCSHTHFSDEPSSQGALQFGLLQGRQLLGHTASTLCGIAPPRLSRPLYFSRSRCLTGTKVHLGRSQ